MIDAEGQLCPSQNMKHLQMSIESNVATRRLIVGKRK